MVLLTQTWWSTEGEPLLLVTQGVDEDSEVVEDVVVEAAVVMIDRGVPLPPFDTMPEDDAWCGLSLCGQQ